MHTMIGQLRGRRARKAEQAILDAADQEGLPGLAHHDLQLGAARPAAVGRHKR